MVLRVRMEGAEPRRGPNRAVGYHRPPALPPGRRPTRASREDVARVPPDPTPGRSLVTRRAIVDIVRAADARLVRGHRVRRRAARALVRPARPGPARAPVRLEGGLDVELDLESRSASRSPRSPARSTRRSATPSGDRSTWSPPAGDPRRRPARPARRGAAGRPSTRTRPRSARATSPTAARTSPDGAPGL